MRTLPALLLACFLLVVASPAAATGITLNPPPADVIRQSDSDRDGDGRNEETTEVGAGGPCGCTCPVVGAGFDWSAAGQEGHVYAATVIIPLCGVAVGAGMEEGNAVDPLGQASVDPFLICYNLCEHVQDLVTDVLGHIDVQGP